MNSTKEILFLELKILHKVYLTTQTIKTSIRRVKSGCVRIIF